MSINFIKKKEKEKISNVLYCIVLNDNDNQ